MAQRPPRPRDVIRRNKQLNMGGGIRAGAYLTRYDTDYQGVGRVWGQFLGGERGSSVRFGLKTAAMAKFRRFVE